MSKTADGDNFTRDETSEEAKGQNKKTQYFWRSCVEHIQSRCKGRVELLSTDSLNSQRDRPIDEGKDRITTCEL